MPEIKLDSNKIKTVNLNSLDINDIQKLMADTQDRVIQEVEESDATLTLASIGAPYKLGPIDINVAIGNVVLLSEINSPFITGDIGEEGEKLETIDCIKAIYVLAKGKEAIEPIMAINQRIQKLHMLKSMVEKNPELFEQLMDRVEKISEAEKEFEKDAMKFYEENFTGYDFQEVVNSLFLSLADMAKMSNDLPSFSGDVVKKK